MRKSRFHRRPRAGFSLVELLIVIAIIGLMAGVSVPAFLTFMKSFRLRTAGRQILGDLNYARQEAITKSRDTYVFFDAATASYDIVLSNMQNGTTLAGVTSARLRPVGKLAKFVDLTETAPTGATGTVFQTASLTAISPRPNPSAGAPTYAGPASYSSQTAVVFRPNGSVTTPGSIWVALQGETDTSRNRPRFIWMALEANSVGKVSTVLGPP